MRSLLVLTLVLFACRATNEPDEPYEAKQDVAESISISAALLGLVTGIPFFIQFVLIDQSLAPALKQGFGPLTGFVFIGV